MLTALVLATPMLAAALAGGGIAYLFNPPVAPVVECLRVNDEQCDCWGLA